MAPAKGVLLAHTDFPLYTVRSLDERHFLIAGGGGQAKTGVANAIEIYDIKNTRQGIRSNCICRHETGIHAIMNCASFYDDGKRNHEVATGEDELCRTYSVKYKVVSPSKKDNEETANGELRHRKNGNDKKAAPQVKEEKQMSFEIEQRLETVTDFTEGGGFQKCVRYFPDSSHLITGGADGHVRVWKRPDLKKVVDIAAHKNEIDDLDISPDGSKIVTVSRDTNAAVWNAKDGKKITDLVWNQKTTAKYRFRFCRYSLEEGKSDKINLFTVNIPVTRSSSAQCYISLWDGKKFELKRTAKTGTDVISAFTVSKDGIYLGIGKITGDVSVYISFSLQKLYCLKEAHSIFVTGVEFLPMSELTKAVTGTQDFNLLSVSADNTVRLHQTQDRSYIHPIWPILIMAIVIYFLFWIMAELGV